LELRGENGMAKSMTNGIGKVYPSAQTDIADRAAIAAGEPISLYPRSGEGLLIYPKAVVFMDSKSGEQVGRLSWDKGEMRFEGEIGSSARKFFEALKNYGALSQLRQ